MLDFLYWRGMGCEWKPLLIFPQLRRPGAEEEEEAEEENNNYNNVEKKVLEMPARRSNYVPLSQLAEPPENPLQEPQQHYPGRHNNLSLPERLAYDHQKWYQFPYPEWSPGGGGVGGGRGFCPSNGLQRQSSGSSFADSSLSSDYPLPTLSPTVSLNASDSAFFNALYDDGWKQNNNEGRLNNNNKLGDGAGKNWAQQTEESYHLQLALALRLSAEATLTEDPHLLAPHCNEPRPGSSGSARNRAQAMSHRFWVNGCLSYYDKVPDGFYQIWGMNPYVWTMCNDVGESGRMPSMESLKGVDASDTSLEVILIDKCADSHLRELENKALGLAHGYSSTKELIEQLGKLVCMLMGGAASTEHGDLMMRWKVSSKMLRDCLNCIVLPIGSLSVGLCRHRALLFKVLADTIDLPCRIARGCKYCGLDDGSSCIVQYGVDREYFVDLIGWPGVLCELDSFLNGPSSSSIASPLRLPEFKSSKFIDEFRSLAKQYVADYESLDLQSKNIGRVQTEDSTIGLQLAIVPSDVTSSMECRGTQPPIKNAPVSNFPVQMAVRCPPERLANDTGPTKNLNLPGALAGMPGKFQAHDQAWKDIENKSCCMTPVSSIAKANLELSLAMDGLEIPWSDLVLKERIGAGSFGTVYHADWHGSDVAVKILVEQDFHEERLKEFLREVAIMKRLRHPNVVLFMGAVTSRPNLSIVTEYLPRGSLYRLLHRAGTREFLDERRRLRMALDVAKGMNYLHRLSPPIVHRDLKSPNLLVDKTWTVKVCDFGLSRLKANTFLSSKSAAGTPEWMAPEVLRDEPSNEKSDVYSFGVILWELITMQQPWSGLNPAQVVGAVGFQNRRLQIPKDMNPDVAAIIESCWANESWQRPTFASIMESLKPLIKPPASPPIHGGKPSRA